ncbi:hypothetical protein VKT23_002686 [Stygiomarasmius scandens]|uniref:Uncharacterized protein n=1 Tax=Marasmiellus scandens TaxID=2682957 RepID=A0ABR1K346_9AGAR
MTPIPTVALPQNSSFQLNSSGLAGFFGGDEAVSAMRTVQIYRGRRFLGFYNAPGGFKVAKYFGRLVKSKSWRGLYPEGQMNPTSVFGFDGGARSPDFLGAQTGIVLEQTGHLGDLFFRKFTDFDEHRLEEVKYRTSRPTTTQVKVFIVTLDSVEMTSTANHVPSIPISTLNPKVLLGNAVVVALSTGFSIASALAGDWYAFSLVLVGMLVNGFACFILGSGKVEVIFPYPPSQLKSSTSARGDGLMRLGDCMLVLLGDEKEVGMMARASVTIEFPSWVKGRKYHVIGLCCMLMMLQLLAQIFLIPQATLFGQILFLLSFLVSWIFNTSLSAVDKGDLHRTVLQGSKDNRVWNVKTERVKAYSFHTWTTMSIAMLYTLHPNDQGMVERILNHLLPNDTSDWKAFKQTIVANYIADPSTFFDREPPGPPPGAKPHIQNMYQDWKDACRFNREKEPRQYIEQDPGKSPRGTCHNDSLVLKEAGIVCTCNVHCRGQR